MSEMLSFLLLLIINIQNLKLQVTFISSIVDNSEIHQVMNSTAENS